MGQAKTIYINEDWLAFSEKVKRRDGYKCLQCRRGLGEVTLQVHHGIYIAGRAPWEYALSDCRTLCKGCHAKEHGLIEPDRGWTLLSIDDLGGLDGICERKNCGAGIRYAHLTCHPKWGYLVVGSTCIEHLTQEDRLLSSNVIHLYQNISNFVHSSEWSRDITQKGKRFISSTYKHHKIRIYGEELSHSFQLALKGRGIRRYDFGNIIDAKGKSTLAVKELAYTALRGTLSESEDEKQYYWSRHRSWPIAIRFKYEFGDTSRHLQKFRAAYFVGAVSFILFVSMVTWFRKDAATADIPLIILASCIHLLRGVAIVSMLFAWLSAEFIQDWLYENASNAWIEKERLRSPDVSFDVPHWRFFVPAALARTLIFLTWLGTMFFLLYVAPGWVSELERFIPDNFPI